MTVFMTFLILSGNIIFAFMGLLLGWHMDDFIIIQKINAVAMKTAFPRVAYDFLAASLMAFIPNLLMMITWVWGRSGRVLNKIKPLDDDCLWLPFGIRVSGFWGAISSCIILIIAGLWSVYLSGSDLSTCRGCETGNILSFILIKGIQLFAVNFLGMILVMAVLANFATHNSNKD